MAPRKEISHLACLVPWPERGGIEQPTYITITAEMLREEADKFGREVIDIWWIREVFKALAEDYEQLESRVTGESCEKCGMPFMHARGCTAIAHQHDFKYDINLDQMRCACGFIHPQSRNTLMNMKGK